MLVAADAELDQSRVLVAKLRRMAFGRSSERLTREADQLELGLKEAEAESRRQRFAGGRASAGRCQARPHRRPLLDHQPRESITHKGPCVCRDCGGALRRMGEDVTEQLDYVPASFRVIRHVRARLSAGLLAHVLVSKYADHLPLYRQSGMYARDGVDLARSFKASIHVLLSPKSGAVHVKPTYLAMPDRGAPTIEHQWCAQRISLHLTFVDTWSR